MRVRFSVACATVAAACAIFPRAVSAYTIDGNQLFELCVAQNPLCTGYLMGVADAKDRDTSGISFCIPERTSPAQLQDIVMAYLRKNTERRFPAPLLVGAAFAEKFRCSN